MFEEVKSLHFFSLKEILRLAQNKFLKKLPNASDLTDSRHIIRDILKAGSVIKTEENRLVIENFEGLQFEARKNSSDLKVFNQVWIKKEYKPVLEYLYERNISVKRILDCGANVGYTSLYFSKYLNPKQIISVEADEQNAALIAKNASLNNSTAICVLHKAIWHKTAMLKINNTFRDGKNWSFAVEETADVNRQTVEAISINDIIQMYHWSNIDVLKIDIEGAERYLFQNNYFKTFLPKVKCLVIEIHDEYDIRRTIYDVLKENSFDFTEAGELTIAFNNGLI
jgi:FkbM family methyltransferase